MKKLTSALLIFLLSMQPLVADSLNDYSNNTDSLYRQGCGAEDGGFSGIALSMFGWGLGLAAGVALLTAFLGSSSSSHSH